mgnify:CR=1 FL=1
MYAPLGSQCMFCAPSLSWVSPMTSPTTLSDVNGGQSSTLGWASAVGADVLAGRRALSPAAWLAATADTQYPDLPPQIVAYFRAARAGDLAVFAAPHWDFRTVNQAGHGGLRPGDLHVPLLIAGPNVPHGTLDHARTVDVLPTLLTLLGEPVPPGLDGRVLVTPGDAAAVLRRPEGP